ncbi:hypothetical protein EBB07_29645 [Paenibacillaceae bacterium]|nr:hypothetical protein EBB07_29645 [Paenibacillaceae bacterium]
MEILNVTLNPNDMGARWDLSNQNLTSNYTTNSSYDTAIRATHGRSTGKWYWEVALDMVGNISNNCIGVSNKSFSVNTFSQSSSNWRGFYCNNGRKFPDNIVYGTSARNKDIIGVGLDLDNFTLEFFKSGVSMGFSHTDLQNMGMLYPTLSAKFVLNPSSNNSCTINFGASPFAYPIPHGFYSYDGSQNTWSNKFLLSSTTGERTIGIEKGVLNSTTAIPNMTSNILPSGIAFSNSENSGNVAWRAFDDIDTSASYWQSVNNNYPIYIGYEFEKQIRIGEYALIVHNTTYSPRVWFFEGSNDGAVWNVLDTQSTALAANTLTTFKINNIGNYKKYRLNIASTNGASTTMLSGFKMYEVSADIVIRLAANTEKNFNKYGVDSPVRFDRYTKIKNVVSDNVSANDGKIFEHTIDLNKRKVNKIVLG